jgi:O-methyltransferase involved in polyketide biosynthesis
MSEISPQNLSDVAETLLVTLCLWAMESQRPDALIKDEKARGPDRENQQTRLIGKQ